MTDLSDLRLSRYVLSVPSNDSVLVVGLLKRAVLEVSPEYWNALSESDDNGNSTLSALPSELISVLVDARILVESSFDELAHARAQSLLARGRPDTFGLIVVPTMSCNMGCHYCFEDKPENDGGLPARISEDLLNFAENRMTDPRLRTFHLRWFGGEPMLEIDRVLEITQKLKIMSASHGRRFRADMVTNGYGITRSCAEEMREAGLQAVQITFEGDQRKHDKIRRLSKAGSFDGIIASLKAAGDLLEFTARVHVAPYSVDTIPRLLRHLHSEGLHQVLKAIYFAPIFNYRQNDPRRNFQENSGLYLSSRAFATHEAELLADARQLGFTTLDPLDADYGVCTALRENTAVMNVDGTLSKCYLDAGDRNESYGNITGDIDNPQNLQKWRDADFSTDPDCAACTFAPVCLGGCDKHARAASDKSMICTSLKYNYADVLQLYHG